MISTSLVFPTTTIGFSSFFKNHPCLSLSDSDSEAVIKIRYDREPINNKTFAIYLKLPCFICVLAPINNAVKNTTVYPCVIKTGCKTRFILNSDINSV